MQTYTGDVDVPPQAPPRLQRRGSSGRREQEVAPWLQPHPLSPSAVDCDRGFVETLLDGPSAPAIRDAIRDAIIYRGSGRGSDKGSGKGSGASGGSGGSGAFFPVVPSRMQRHRTSSRLFSYSSSSSLVEGVMPTSRENSGESVGARVGGGASKGAFGSFPAESSGGGGFNAGTQASSKTGRR